MTECSKCGGTNINKTGRCRPCWAKYMREYHNRDGRQKIKQQQKKWRKNNPDTYKNSNLKTKFGITLEDYYNLEKQQNYVCAVCKEPKKKHIKYFHVDHNHTTGEVRGLLCSLCNTALGSLKEDTTIMRNLIEYTLKYNGAR